jgi:molybdate transport system substrate-binding protein
VRAAASALACLALALTLACGDDGEGQTVRVFAASSLTDAFTEIGERFEERGPGVNVEFNFAGSPALRTQIAEGARADVLATADVDNMRAALEQELVADEGVAFARNRLVLIVPASNDAGIESLEDLATPGVKLVLALAEVPVGRYARDAIRKMAFDDDFAERVLANIVSEEPNVKAVVAKVQLGEADAGIVYASDVTQATADEVTAFEIPDPYNVIATYPIAVTAGASDNALPQAFIDFVLSDEGQSILQRHGFMSIR